MDQPVVALTSVRSNSSYDLAYLANDQIGHKSIVNLESMLNVVTKSNKK